MLKSAFSCDLKYFNYMSILFFFFFFCKTQVIVTYYYNNIPLLYKLNDLKEMSNLRIIYKRNL